MTDRLDPPTLLSEHSDAGVSLHEVGVEPRLHRVAVAIIAGLVLVLIVGAVVGATSPRAEDTADVATTVPVESSIAPTTTTGVDAPAATIAVTTAPALPTETAPRDTVPLGEAFAAFPPQGQLVVWSLDRPVVQILDLAAGTSSEIDLDFLELADVKAITGVGSKLVIESKNGFSWADPNGGFGTLAPGGEARAFGDDEVWLSAAYVSNRSFTATRASVDGEVTDLPELPAGVFPFGAAGDALVVGGGAAGGVYVHEGNGYRELSPGGLLGTGDGAVLARVCDHTLECSVHRVDVDTGAVEVHSLHRMTDLAGVWWLEDTVSPDALSLLVMSGAEPVLWDLESGVMTPVPVQRGRPIAWSADSQWLFIGGNAEIVGIHRPTGDEVRFEVPGDFPWDDSMRMNSLAAP